MSDHGDDANTTVPPPAPGLEKYELEYDLEGSGFYKLHDFYLAAEVEARDQKIIELAREFPELNPRNFDADDITRLNQWGIEMCALLAQLRGGGG